MHHGLQRSGWVVAVAGSVLRVGAAAVGPGPRNAAPGVGRACEAALRLRMRRADNPAPQLDLSMAVLVNYGSPICPIRYEMCTRSMVMGCHHPGPGRTSRVVHRIPRSDRL